MDYLTKSFENVLLFLESHGEMLATSVFWIIILLVVIAGISRRAALLKLEVDDLVASNRWDIDLVVDAEQSKKLADDAWLAAANENLKLKRENYALKEKISRKREFRLRNGLWCTEEQYLAELYSLNLSEKLADADINEEANKQIEEFLQTDKK